MFHIYPADADTYITNKMINGEPKVSSSLGFAGTIDLYKLYNSSSIETRELTRGLIHFDLSKLKQLHQDGLIDISHPTFKCHVNLFDVYGGQATPANFDLTIAPLSRSFDEGFGKDIVYLLDYDVANFESSSLEGGSWIGQGASSGGSWNSFSVCDFFTTADFGPGQQSLVLTQSFKTGEENLNIDITNVVSATLAGLLPDSGFRISFTAGEEQDNNTYFVKRFASRHAYNSLLHPRLVVKFDNSISDSSANLNLNSSGSLFLYNYVDDTLTNLLSGGQDITGVNCIGLTLKTKTSSGNYNLIFTGSQFSRGNWIQSGTYKADVYIGQTAPLLDVLNVSGSINFTPVWHSLDGTINYITGSILKVYGATTHTSPLGKKKYIVSVSGIPDVMNREEKTIARVNIFDSSDPLLTTVRFPVNRAGKVIKKCYYSIRDADTQDVIVPFDEIHNSTRISSDENGMYFQLDGNSLLPNRSYVIDIKAISGGDEAVYRNSSIIFKVTGEAQ